MRETNFLYETIIEDAVKDKKHSTKKDLIILAKNVKFVDPEKKNNYYVENELLKYFLSFMNKTLFLSTYITI